MAVFIQARQRQPVPLAHGHDAPPGSWDMTASSDEEHWCHPIGYCAGWQDLTSKPGDDTWTRGMWEALQAARKKALPFKGHYHDDGHESAEEAERCWRRYLRDQCVEFRTEPTVLAACVECDWLRLSPNPNHADGRAAIRNPYTSSREIPLCAGHCTLEVAIRHLYPESKGEKGSQA